MIQELESENVVDSCMIDGANFRLVIRHFLEPSTVVIVLLVDTAYSSNSDTSNIDGSCLAEEVDIRS